MEVEQAPEYVSWGSTTSHVEITQQEVWSDGRWTAPQSGKFKDSRRASIMTDDKIRASWAKRKNTSKKLRAALSQHVQARFKCQHALCREGAD